MEASQLLPAVDQQLASSDTPYVGATLNRLVSEHELEPEEGRLMIAVCLADELERLLDEERAFDEERYRTLLDLLPTLPE